MASEQERKEAFLRAWFGVPEGVHWAHGMSNEVEQGVNDCFDQAITAWNTRPAPADLKARDRKRYKLIRKSLQNKGLLPAATDTGLETVADLEDIRKAIFGDVGDEPNVYSDYDYLCELSRKMREAIRFCLQAEKLLAAKEAERAEQWRFRREMEADRDTQKAIAASLAADNAAKDARIKELSANYTAMEEQLAKEVLRVEALEAKLAAKDARVKELEKECGHWKEYSSGQGKLIESGVFVKNDEYVRLIALEAKLAAAEKALEPFADIADLIDAETEGMAETDELILLFHDYEFAKWPVSLFRQARAVLGGKPS
jgi:hypothetical protein